MTALITLTTAGTDSGPFNLYTNLDSYATAFATGVAKSALVAGYTSTAVPNGATIIRVKSTGACTNYIDITLSNVTTTTTTTRIGIAVSIQIGDQFCLAGNCTLNGNLSTVTVYSLTGTAVPGDIIYTTAALTTPYTTLKFIKKGTNIMDVNSGTGELYLDCSTSGSGAC